MLRLSSRRAAIAVSAGVTVLALGAAALPAQAAAVPGWRAAATFSVRNQAVLLSSVDAPSRRDAWAAGTGFTTTGGMQTLIRHWNGKSWTKVSLPPKIAAAWRKTEPLQPVIGAVSAANVWIFGALRNGSYLHLTGKTWRLARLPGVNLAAGKTVQVNAVLALGASNVWAFGTINDFGAEQPTVGAYAAHFNGHRWTVTAVPGNNGITNVSPDSSGGLWAVAGRPSAAMLDAGAVVGKQVVLRWTPRAGWQEPAQPTLPKGADINAVLARPGQVIVGGSEPNGRKGRSPLTVTWNGTAWSRPSLGAASSAKWTVISLAADGRGGIWALGIATNRMSTTLWHLTGGKWTKVQPAFGRRAWQLLQLASVAHTDSVWGAGALKAGKSAVGLLALAGPSPR